MLFIKSKAQDLLPSPQPEESLTGKEYRSQVLVATGIRPAALFFFAKETGPQSLSKVYVGRVRGGNTWLCNSSEDSVNFGAEV